MNAARQRTSPFLSSAHSYKMVLFVSCWAILFHEDCLAGSGVSGGRKEPNFGRVRRSLMKEISERIGIGKQRDGSARAWFNYLKIFSESVGIGNKAPIHFGFRNSFFISEKISTLMSWYSWQVCGCVHSWFHNPQSASYCRRHCVIPFTAHRCTSSSMREAKPDTFSQSDTFQEGSLIPM